MKRINLVYEYDYDDVDILEIPDEIFPHIQDLSQDYLSWIPPKDNENEWIKYKDGSLVLSKGSKGFVSWLNHNFCKNEKASVLFYNTKFDKSLKRIDF